MQKTCFMKALALVLLLGMVFSIATGAIPFAPQEITAPPADSPAVIAGPQETAAAPENMAAITPVAAALSGTAARAAQSTNMIDVTSLITGSGYSRELDLAKVKATDFSGTLYWDAGTGSSAANSRFVRIVDTSLSGGTKGSYDILLGEYCGVEVTLGAGAENTFGTITTGAGVTNIMSVFAEASVTNIVVDGEGTVITLHPVVSVTAADAMGYATSYPGIVVSGIATSVEHVHINDVKTETSVSVNYSGPNYSVFIGAQRQGYIEYFAVGNVQLYGVSYAGAVLGAAYGSGIESFWVYGLVSVTSSSSNSVCVGSEVSYVKEMVFTATADVRLEACSTAGSQGTLVGFLGTLNNTYYPRFASMVQSGLFAALEGSKITLSRCGGGSLSTAVGGQGRYLDFAGEINIGVISSGEFGCGVGASDINANVERLLVRSTARITFEKTAGYIMMGVGINGTYSAARPQLTIKEIIVERGAKIDLSVTTHYSIKNHYVIETAIGRVGYGGEQQTLVGATYNPALNGGAGGYEVLPDVDPANQTEIRLNNFRAIYGGNVTTNANVYAEMDDPDIPFYGCNSIWVNRTGTYCPPLTAIIMGGNYLVRNTALGTFSHVQFNVNVAHGQFPPSDSLNVTAKNQYGENLYEMLYTDAAAGATFGYNVPASGFGVYPAAGCYPEYDYIISESFAAGVPATAKALYYPRRQLNVRLADPVQGGTVPLHGTLEIEFDRPMYSAENVDNGNYFGIPNGGNMFTIYFTTANSARYVFGSDLPGGDPTRLYIYLDGLMDDTGVYPLVPGYANMFFVSNQMRSTVNQPNNDPQLAIVRPLNDAWSDFVLRASIYYNVDFSLNGAPGTNPATQNIREGSLAAAPPAPAWSGHLFDGWYTAGGVKWDFAADIPQGNVTLHAQWTTLYSIKYDVNWGGLGTSQIADQTGYIAGSTVTLRSIVPQRGGYAFVEWNTAADGSGTSYAPGGSLRMPQADVTLYAQWVTAYRVMYDVNWGGLGTSQIADQTGNVAGSTVTLRGIVPQRNGYTFVEWNTAADGSGTSYAPGGSLQMPRADVRLYAQWQAASSSGSGSTRGPDPDSSSSSAPPPSSISSVPPSSSQQNNSQGNVNGDGTPNALFQRGNVWALLNLILMVVGLLLAVVCTIIGVIRGKDSRDEEEQGEEKKRGSALWRLLSVVLAVVSLVLFLLTQNMSQPMVLVDKWTLAMLVLFVAEVVCLILAGKKKGGREEQPETYDYNG